MQQLIEAMKRIAHQVVDTRAQPRWGIVQSVDPSGPYVKVLAQPEGVLSGWLPVLQASAGTGVTDVTIPMPGWQAFLGADLGEAEHGVVLGFAHSDAATFPQVPNAAGTGGTPSTTNAAGVAGERIIKAFGSVIRLCANGDIYLQPGSGTVHIDGNLVCNGDVSDRHGSLDRLRGNYDAHKHGGVQSGGGSTATTDHPDPE